MGNSELLVRRINCVEYKQISNAIIAIFLSVR